MVWNYQNEIAPIFYYGMSTKTNEKDLKIPSLQPSEWKNPYWMSLYDVDLIVGYLYDNSDMATAPNAPRPKLILCWIIKLFFMES